LVASSLQEYLNKWTALALLVSFGVFVFLPVAKFVWKLLTPNIQHDQQFKMFDLSSDPQEKLEITGNPDGVTEQLKAKLLDRYMKLEKPGPQKDVSITPEQLEMLKSLGYVQ